MNAELHAIESDATDTKAMPAPTCADSIPTTHSGSANRSRFQIARSSSSRARFPDGVTQDTPLDNEETLYNYLAAVSGPRKRVTPGVSTTRVRDGHDLYGSYHFARFYYPVAVRDTLRRFRMFQAPADMHGRTVYEFGCCIGALGLECVRRGARVTAWEYNPAKVFGCQRLAKFLGLPPDQISFYQQDLRVWLSNPAAAQAFRQRFPPADLTICCAVDIYIPKDLRPELYRFLAHASRRLCWFESNSGETREQLEEQFLKAGFQHVSYMGKCGHRHVFVAGTAALPVNSSLVRNISPTRQGVLTNKQHARLAGYTQAFLAASEHSRYFDHNPEEILRSLANPHRLSIALMPIDKHISSCENHRAVNAWYYKYVKEYSRRHKRFLNNLDRGIKSKLYTAKLLRHDRETNIRDFLAVLARVAKKSAAEGRFFDGLNLKKNVHKQGVRVWDCHDYSSGRGYDEGAIVNRIVLLRKGGRVAFFLKGLGKIRKAKVKGRGIKGFENFEVTALKAAGIVGLNTIECKCYRDDADATMVGYTLFQEVEAINTNNLFTRLRGPRFAIQPPYASFRDRLIREFARIAAFCDLLRKGDRKIVQSIHPEYDANCLVNIDLLRKRSRRPAVWVIDFNHLFQSDNRGVLHDLNHGKCAEIGIVSAFPEFYSGARARSKLLKKYQKAYLAQWARIHRKWQALEELVAEQHGRRSLEYKIFRESLATNPRLEFQAQKAALIRAAAKEEHPAKSRKPYHLIGHGLHGRVYKLSSQCCIKIFRLGKHAEIERRAYEAARGCRFVPKLYEAGPNHIIIEYVRGETLKEHLKRTGRVSAALTTQILSLFRELKRIGFTWTNFAIRHYLLTREGQLKVIDLKNAYDQPNDVPHMLMKSLSRMGLREDFLRRVDKLDRSLGAKWRRATAEKKRALALPDLTTGFNNGKGNPGKTGSSRTRV